MKQNLSMNLLIRLQKLDFSLDEVVLEFEEVFKAKGLPGILEVILEYIDSLLISNIEGVVIPKQKRECCACDKWHLHGRTSKTVKTGIGKLKLNLNRMRCSSCNTTHSPFNIFFGLSRSINFTNELQKKCCETVLEQSYRRSARSLNLIGKLGLNKNEVHRIVNLCDLDFQNISNLKNINSLMADGTGYKPHFEDQKGELKIVIGLNSLNRPVPIGAWIMKGWKAIGNEVKKANSPANKKLAFKPIANVLITDGEIALIKGLKDLAYHEQRCQWHFIRDFKNAYVYQESGSKTQCRELQNLIGTTINNCMDTLEKKTKEDLIKTIAESEIKLQELEVQLKKDKFLKSAVYVRNAREELFTHLKYILTTGEEVYRTTSVIERLMRELARRFKRIAHNWSEAGAEKLGRMLLRYTLDKNGWEKVWKDKIVSTGNFKLVLSDAYST